MRLDKYRQGVGWYRLALRELDSVTLRVSGNCQELHTEANQGGAMWYLGAECASGEPNSSGALSGNKSHKFTTAEGPIL